MFSDPESDHIFSHFFGKYLVYILFLLVCGNYSLTLKRGGVGIYCALIPGLFELNQAKILFPHKIKNGDTEPNYTYCLKEYFNIA